LTTLVH
jgi:alcohol dehydrogenase (NADP+)